MTEWPVETWLAEDATSDDVTSQALVPEEALARGTLRAKQTLVAAGLGPAAAVFEHLGCKVVERVEDGVSAEAGQELLVVDGPARAVLAGERVALNLVMHLSGIATLTAHVVERVRAANPACEVLATRKTTPGLRTLEHQAVVAGGGTPHRADLAGAVLVKENHLRYLTIAEAVERARATHPDLFVMVEAESPEEAMAVARAGADGVLLDELSPETTADVVELVRRLKPDIVVEASGGLTLDNVADHAAHVDRVSLGALTHSARAADVSMDVEVV